jgi:transcription elongation factor GreA
MEKVPMTQPGFQRLEAELKNLKSVERPAVIDAIATARALGDLSENAEYHAAREKQGFIEGRIAELESKLSRADVIDVTKMSRGIIKFGATVTVADEETDAETTYQIVGADEADLKNNKLSLSAPMSRALIGKQIGDSVEVRSPGGTKSYEVVTVEYK